VPSAIVAGAGVFGASLAHRLAGEGWDVVLVDREEPGTPRAESAGESRLLRYAHGVDAWYARSARRARELWRELEEETGRSLLVEAGLVWFAHREGGWESESEEVLRAEGIPVSRLDPDEIARLYPSVAVDDLVFGLLESEAGVLRARECTLALVDAALARGARLELGAATPDGAAVLLEGRRLEADVVVWACGAWLARLFQELVDLRVTEQALFFVDVPAEWSTPPVPAFVDYDGAAYGLGALDGNGLKVGSDFDGPPFDPDTWPRTPPAESERRAREFLRRRFPALADEPFATSASCHYSLTGDTHFIAAPHPEHESVWIVGGGSGHGFKHGPAFAELLHDQLAARAAPDPRFALGPREPDRSLRTAGVRGLGRE
jgi:glycine/D-amino acid oxidase-like deaminating enzyme